MYPYHAFSNMNESSMSVNGHHGVSQKLHFDLTVALPIVLPNVWKLALRITRDSGLAEQLVGQAYAKTLTHETGSLQIEEAFIKVASNIVELWQALERSCKPCRRGYHTSANNVDLLSAIDRLPDVDRICIFLVDAHGLSVHKAAQVLKIPACGVIRLLLITKTRLAWHLVEAD